MKNYIFCLLLLSFFSCSKKNNEIPLSIRGLEYFPIQKGNYWIYDVTDTLYVFAEPKPIFKKYQYKYEIGDTVVNKPANYMMQWIRSARTLPDTVWKVDTIWGIEVKDNRFIITQENNTRIVKFDSPLIENQSFNQNSFNTLPVSITKLKNIGKPYFVDKTKYEETLTRLEKMDTISILETTVKFELYAKSKGMIYKNDKQLVYKQDEFIGKKIIQEGQIKTFSLNTFFIK